MEQREREATKLTFNSMQRAIFLGQGSTTNNNNIHDNNNFAHVVSDGDLGCKEIGCGLGCAIRTMEQPRILLGRQCHKSSVAMPKMFDTKDPVQFYQQSYTKLDVTPSSYLYCSILYGSKVIGCILLIKWCQKPNAHVTCHLRAI